MTAIWTKNRFSRTDINVNRNKDVKPSCLQRKTTVSIRSKGVAARTSDNRV